MKDCRNKPMAGLKVKTESWCSKLLVHVEFVNWLSSVFFLIITFYSIPAKSILYYTNEKDFVRLHHPWIGFILLHLFFPPNFHSFCFQLFLWYTWHTQCAGKMVSKLRTCRSALIDTNNFGFTPSDVENRLVRFRVNSEKQTRVIDDKGRSAKRCRKSPRF